MEENEDITQKIKLEELKQAVAIGADQAENDEFSSRSVHDIVTEVNKSDFSHIHRPV